MTRTTEVLTMYGQTVDHDRLDWAWVDAELKAAGAYWIVPRGQGHPHPRPVWGVWHNERLYLSIGSPRIASDVGDKVPVTVHLGGANDVVIIEGTGAGSTIDGEPVDIYNIKYDWDYRVDEYGPLTIVEPAKILAWRSTGWAGRDGFEASGRWSFHR